MSRPTPEELRRRLSERLAAEPPRGQTMTQAPPTPPPVSEPDPTPIPTPTPTPVARASEATPPATPAKDAPGPAPTNVPIAEVKVTAPTPAPKTRSVATPSAVTEDRIDADSPTLRQPKPVVRRNDERGRLRSHPVSEALYLDIARTKLRAKRGEKLTWDAILQHGLDLVIARPSQLESLLNEVDTLTSKARRTIAATISIDHDIAMQELLLDRPSIGTVRPRLKLEDVWCAALIAWKRTIP